MEKAIITVVGKDKKGIMARVCTYLSDNDINILDISQTIVDEYFNMMMIADVAKTGKKFTDISDDLDIIGNEIECIIKIQREDIFNNMHRI